MNNTKGSLNPREGPSVLVVQDVGWNQEGSLTWWWRDNSLSYSHS